MKGYGERSWSVCRALDWESRVACLSLMAGGVTVDCVVERDTLSTP